MVTEQVDTGNCSLSSIDALKYALADINSMLVLDPTTMIIFLIIT